MAAHHGEQTRIIFSGIVLADDDNNNFGAKTRRQIERRREYQINKARVLLSEWYTSRKGVFS